MKSDIEIAQEAKMKPITEIAASLGLADEDVIPYGRYKAKINHRLIHKASRQGHQPHPGGRGQNHHQRGPGRCHERSGQKDHALPA